MSSKPFYILVLLAAIGLAGCRADVTYAVDVHPNQTATLSVLETFDDQLFEIANSEGGADPFGTAVLTARGWALERKAASNGTHTILLTRTVPLSQVGVALKSASAPVDGRAVKTTPSFVATIKQVSGFFYDRYELNQTIPPLMAESAESRNDPFASAGAAMASSMIGVHFQLRTPGHVVATNGEQTDDGYTRWDLGLAKPTKIQYAVSAPNLMSFATVVAASTLALVILGAITLAALRSNKPLQSTVQE